MISEYIYFNQLVPTKQWVDCLLQAAVVAVGGTAGWGRKGRASPWGVRKPGRFGGLQLDEKTHLCKSLWIIYNFLAEKTKQKFVVALRALTALKCSANTHSKCRFQRISMLQAPLRLGYISHQNSSLPSNTWNYCWWEQCHEEVIYSISQQGQHWSSKPSFFVT